MNHLKFVLVKDKYLQVLKLEMKYMDGIYQLVKNQNTKKDKIC